MPQRLDALEKLENKLTGLGADLEKLNNQLPIQLNSLEAIDNRIHAFEYQREYKDWDSAKKDIERLINESFEKSRLKRNPTTVDCLGVALHVSWKKLEECIMSYFDNYKESPLCTIRLKALNETWKGWEDGDIHWNAQDNSRWKKIQ